MTARRSTLDLRALTGGPAGLVLQGALLVGVVALMAWLASNATTNIEARGLASGFDFLGREAGFGITQTLIDYEPTDTHARVFVVGALNTLLVAALSIGLATAFGLIAGVMRTSRNYLARLLATSYVEIARNTPLPIQILIWYALMLTAPPPREAIGMDGALWLSNRGLYVPQPLWNDQGWLALGLILAGVIAGVALGLWLGRQRIRHGHGASPRWGWAVAALGLVLGLVLTGNPTGFSVPRADGFGFVGGFALMPALVALWMALSFYTGGFIAEIVRGGINAVSPGQSEAARAVGLNDGQTTRLVVLPQALRVMVPPLASQYLNVAKNSSLAVIIGYPDLVAVFAGTSLNQTGQAIEILALVMLFYLTLSISISLFMNWWNSRTAVWAVQR